MSNPKIDNLCLVNYLTYAIIYKNLFLDFFPKSYYNLFEHWEKDNIDGPIIWACKKRNMLPQKPVYDSIMKKGIWNLDEMNLGRNPTWRPENE